MKEGEYGPMDLAARGDEGPQTLSLVTLLNVPLRHVRLIVGIPLVFAVLGVVAILLRSPQYQAESLLKPHASTGATSRLAGLASQFGIGGIAPGTEDSPEFYASVLTSSDLLRATVLTEFRIAVAPDGLDTIQTTLLELDGGEPDRRHEDRVQQAVSQLRGRVAASPELASGLLRLRSTAEWPELSVAINRRMIELLHEFNRARRQSQAAAERRWIVSRLDQARVELEGAENELKAFLEENRSIGDSPQLIFERSRLQRQVDLRQQIYLSLAEAHEQARIDEVRNTPVVIVVDRPEGSARSAGPGLLVVTLIALLGGFLVALLVAVLMESLARAQAEAPTEYVQFQHLRQTALRRLLPPFGRFGSRRT